jgi:hypothetical protein
VSEADVLRKALERAERAEAQLILAWQAYEEMNQWLADAWYAGGISSEVVMTLPPYRGPRKENPT